MDVYIKSITKMPYKYLSKHYTHDYSLTQTNLFKVFRKFMPTIVIKYIKCNGKVENIKYKTKIIIIK